MKKIPKYIKYYCVIICLVTAGIIAAVNVSVAVYTNFNSVKRVVSLGKVIDTKFDSNYLSLVSLGETDYSVRRISASEIKGEDGTTVTGYTFTVRICNYSIGNDMVWNDKDIKYKLDVKLVSRKGDKLPEGITNIKIKQASVENTPEGAVGNDGSFLLESQNLSAEKANKLDYVFTVPADVKDAVNIQIVAEPYLDYQVAVQDQKLAAIINLSSLTMTESWTGDFIDDDSIAANQYDFYNYEISGYGQGTVTLTWPVTLQVSQWFIQDLKDKHGQEVTVNNNSDGTCSCTFYVGGTGENDITNACQLQFYKIGKKNFTWDELRKMVTVVFKKNQEQR